jgi:hypothetical protein
MVNPFDLAEEYYEPEDIFPEMTSPMNRMV